MKKQILLILIPFALSCGIDKESPPVIASENNTGELDSTFNGNGYLVLNGSAGGSSDDEIYDMVTDSNGRIIAVGSSTNVGGDKDMTVWVLNTSGALDSSFASSGVFTHDNAAGGSGNDIGYSVTLDTSNNIFVTGTSINGSGNFDMVVWKMDANGNLDSSFSGGGVFTHDGAAGGNLQDQGSAIALTSTGQVAVAGFSDQTLSNRDMAIWMLSSSGSLDSSFSGDGIFTDDGSAGGQDDDASGLVLDSLNNLYVVGRADSVSSLGDMAVWKISSSGSLDTSFSDDGFFSHNSAAGGNGFDAATDIISSPSGGYVITGYSRNLDGNSDMVIWKLSSDGTLDSDFDDDGLVVFDVSSVVGGSTNDTGESVFIDSDGKLVIAGSGNDDMCIWRYDETGSLDTTFNTDGFFSHDSAAGGFDSDAATSVTEDSLGNIYVGGFSENSSNDFDTTFWRLK